MRSYGRKPVPSSSYLRFSSGLRDFIAIASSTWRRSSSRRRQDGEADLGFLLRMLRLVLNDDDDAERRNVLPNIVFCDQRSILECLTVSPPYHQHRRLAPGLLLGGRIKEVKMSRHASWTVSWDFTTEKLCFLSLQV